MIFVLSETAWVVQTSFPVVNRRPWMTTLSYLDKNICICCGVRRASPDTIKYFQPNACTEYCVNKHYTFNS